MESVESQKQASPSSHEPLGNPANDRRDSHIPTAPTTKADGKVENQNQVSHFPTATIPSFPTSKNTCGRGFAAPPRLRRSAAAHLRKSLGATDQTTKGDSP